MLSGTNVSLELTTLAHRERLPKSRSWRLAVRETSLRTFRPSRTKIDLGRKRPRLGKRVQEEIAGGDVGVDGGRAVTACKDGDAEVQVAVKENPAQEEGIAGIANGDAELKPLARPG